MTSLFEDKAFNLGSFLRRSLLWGKELVEKESRWRVGNGWSIHIYKDHWISWLSTFKIVSPPGLGEWAAVDALKL